MGAAARSAVREDHSLASLAPGSPDLGGGAGAQVIRRWSTRSLDCWCRFRGRTRSDFHPRTVELGQTWQTIPPPTFHPTTSIYSPPFLAPKPPLTSHLPPLPACHHHPHHDDPLRPHGALAILASPPVNLLSIPGKQLFLLLFFRLLSPFWSCSYSFS